MPHPRQHDASAPPQQPSAPGVPSSSSEFPAGHVHGHASGPGSGHGRALHARASGEGKGGGRRASRLGLA
ncbi:nucleoside recognition domain-containing protein, partial [Desulfovibrio sp. DS-1]